MSAIGVYDESVLAETNQDVDLETEIGQETEQAVVNNVELYSAYDGGFSSSYVEYFRGFASKLLPGQHYLCYRNGQYSYIFYYSEDLFLDGSIVWGTADYYELNTRTNSLSVGVGSVYEDLTSGMYYSDYSPAPSLLGGDYYVQMALLFAVCIFIVLGLLHFMFKLPRRFRSS